MLFPNVVLVLCPICKLDLADVALFLLRWLGIAGNVSFMVVQHNMITHGNLSDSLEIAVWAIKLHPTIDRLITIALRRCDHRRASRSHHLSLCHSLGTRCDHDLDFVGFRCQLRKADLHLLCLFTRKCIYAYGLRSMVFFLLLPFGSLKVLPSLHNDLGRGRADSSGLEISVVNDSTDSIVVLLNVCLQKW